MSSIVEEVEVPVRKRRRTEESENHGGSRELLSVAEQNRLEKIRHEGATWGLAEVLLECGVDIRNPAEHNCRIEAGVSSTSLRASVHALLCEMNRSGIDPDNTRVIESMEELVAGSDDNSSQLLLNSLLSPMEPTSPQDTDVSSSPVVVSRNKTHTSAQPSLIKILLKVEILQPPLLTALFLMLAELGASAEVEENGMNSAVPRLILSQIKWLDRIVDAEGLTSTALQCLSALVSTSPSSVDHTEDNGSTSTTKPKHSLVLDLIATLPDILVDDTPERMEEVVSTLRDIRDEDPSLLLPVLDAFGSLRLTREQMNLIVDDALRSLHTCHVSALPTLCSFLVQQVPPDNHDNGDLLTRVVDGLRHMRLGETDLHLDDADEQSHGNRKGPALLQRADAEALTLEALSRGFQYRQDLTASLLQTVKATPPGYHAAADVWLLLCCAVAPHNRGKVRSVVRSKAGSGAFTKELLQDAISGNGKALGFLFQSAALTLADSLLRAPETSSRELGGSLYLQLFQEFGDLMQRQEIVGSLVTHVGSGSLPEVDTAMEVFSHIVGTTTGTTKLRPFSSFLISLLDHIQQLTSSQVRRLFLILFAVGDNDLYDADDDVEDGSRTVGVGSGGCDDVHIVIRKHLSLTPISMKRIGIIGAVSFAVSASTICADAARDEAFTETEETCLNDPSNDPTSRVIKEAIDVLSMACDNCVQRTKLGTNDYTEDELNHGVGSHTSSALALFFDELCYAVRGRRLAPAIKVWIRERFTVDLEDIYLGDFATEDSETPATAPPISQHEVSSLSLERIENPRDRALVAGIVPSFTAPQGAMRYSCNALDAPTYVVYLRLLPLLASRDPSERDIFPQQLCPLLQLLVTCHDKRYGGLGVGDIDALLGCPMLLPTETSIGMAFEHLTPAKQWTATASTFFATCWCRELINVFIHSAAFRVEGQDDEELRTMVVERLKALVRLEEDLRFASSKCYIFSPPGSTPLPVPRELTMFAENVEETVLGQISSNVPHGNDESSEKMTKEERKALAVIKKAAAKKMSERAKSKQKILKVRSKFETALSEHAHKALRPLGSLVCLALGFPELSILGQEDGVGSQRALSLGASQLQNLKVGGPVTIMLLSQLSESLQSLFSSGKVSTLPRFMTSRSPVDEEACELINDFATNPYAECDASIHGTRAFVFLDLALAAGVFASVHEQLAAVAEIRGSDNDGGLDDDREADTKKCSQHLLSCVKSIVSAQEFTSNAKGRKYLELILKQLSAGDREGGNKADPVSMAGLNKSLFDLFDLVDEIVMGGNTDDLSFVIHGVECLEAVVNCILRLETVMKVPSTIPEQPVQDKSARKVAGIRKKLSDLSRRLLQSRQWTNSTKFGKNNVGKLIMLYVEHSCITIPLNRPLTPSETSEVGHIGALQVLIKEALAELPNTAGCKGPVEGFPTCCLQSFGSYYSAVFAFLPKELNNLFESSLVKSDTADSIEAAIELLCSLVTLFGDLCDLTKENPELVRKPYLLSQLKGGTRFMEIFVARAVPYLQKHFQQHNGIVITIIKEVQKSTRQLGRVIAHGKREKDAHLAKETPRAKKILETFMHTVKRLFRKNRCMTAIWCANLKNRNIDGSIIEDEKIEVDNSEGDESSKEDEVEAELLTDESDSDEE